LNAILGFSEAMREQFFGPLGNDRYREYAAHVHSSGQHLLTLTVQILELSQGEAGKLELNETAVDLAAVVRNCLDVMTPAAQKAELTLKDLVPTGLPLIRADETKIRQMLFYLVDNAIKFTPHGRVSIEASAAADGGIDLVVRDTGIGMKAEDIPLALQPFGRIASPLKHKNEGMGLGLPWRGIDHQQRARQGNGLQDFVSRVAVHGPARHTGCRSRKIRRRRGVSGADRAG
jgi:signal transduction histidine kinase